MAQALAQPHALQGCRGTLARIGCTVQFQRQHHVFQCGQGGQQLERLEHETCQSSAQARAAIFIEGENIHAVEIHRAAAGRIQPGQQAEQGGLAGTGRAEDGEAVARFHGKIDFVQYDQRRGFSIH